MNKLAQGTISRGRSHLSFYKSVMAVYFYPKAGSAT
ncbi:hypothetical protein BBR47_27970 [Brevibacillus brevis NBRC 100599]|uniref:Uncharacterized protein n=1 Tax=Brevibacillus brevis (strain 47 / JCM 6285 / NBRC 100599) TaxID=358681 RepID=C0ZDB5_BREBN|nr:hypothetical protein BBR47_27970 [Brevibacillus brevis NBRC 100599]